MASIKSPHREQNTSSYPNDLFHSFHCLHRFQSSHLLCPHVFSCPTHFASYYYNTMEFIIRMVSNITQSTSTTNIFGMWNTHYHYFHRSHMERIDLLRHAKHDDLVGVGLRLEGGHLLCEDLGHLVRARARARARVRLGVRCRS